MNKDFPFLSLISRVLKVLGIIFIIIGLILIIVALSDSGIGKAIYLSMGISLLVFGLIFVVISESTGVLLSIEWNTHQSRNYLYELSRNHKINAENNEEYSDEEYNHEEKEHTNYKICPQCKAENDEFAKICTDCRYKFDN